MYVCYEDILSRIKEEPAWWDENGTPRFGKFDPDLVPNIYVDEVALVLIQCQSCKTKFNVAISKDRYGKFKLSELIEKHQLYYGDPPNNGCCCSGPSMSSEAVGVIEYYELNTTPSKEGTEFIPKWNRVSKFEIMFPEPL